MQHSIAERCNQHFTPQVHSHYALQAIRININTSAETEIVKVEYFAIGANASNSLALKMHRLPSSFVVVHMLDGLEQML